MSVMSSWKTPEPTAGRRAKPLSRSDERMIADAQHLVFLSMNMARAGGRLVVDPQRTRPSGPIGCRG